MRLLIAHPDACRSDGTQTLDRLYELTLELGASLDLLSSLDDVQAALWRAAPTGGRTPPYDLALLWIDFFTVEGGIQALESFLQAIAPVQPVLVVPPAFAGLSQQAARLSVRDVWVLDDGRPETLRARLEQFSLSAERGASTEGADAPAQPQPLPAAPYPQPAAGLQPASAGLPRVSGRATGAPAQRPTYSSATPPAAPKGAPAWTAGPAPRATGSGKRVGVWSAVGGAGVTTLAIALAQLTARPLLSLSEPGLSLALGLSDPPTLKALQVGSLKALYLGPSLLATGSDEAERAAADLLSLVGPDAILDLPTGPAPLALRLVEQVDCLLYVLLPDRVSVALGVQALAGLSRQHAQIVWNRASASAVAQASAGLTLLGWTPPVAGQIEDANGVREARERCQSILDAASDGVSLGAVPAQIHALAGVLYPSDVPAPAPARRGRGRLVEIVE